MCKSSSTLVLVVSGFMALTRAKNHATFLLFPSSHNTNAAAICHKKWHSSQGKLDWNIGFSSRAKGSRFISQNFVFFFVDPVDVRDYEKLGVLSSFL